MNPRADQEIAIAQREAERVRQERESRCAEVIEELIWSMVRPLDGEILCQLLRSHRLVTELRKAAAAAAKRTGLEPVEAAKLSECHELLAEVVG